VEAKDASTGNIHVRGPSDDAVINVANIEVTAGNESANSLNTISTLSVSGGTFIVANVGASSTIAILVAEHAHPKCRAPAHRRSRRRRAGACRCA
jgi:hypothetical protein